MSVMLCRDIIDVLEEAYSGKYALPWDNVGLLAGRDDKEVKRIYVAVDATDEVICDALRLQADMLITHHPLIFGGVNRINNKDFIGNRLITLIQNDISYYAMHTNYDVLGMGALSGDCLHIEHAEVLEVTEEDCAKEKIEGIGRIGNLKEKISLRECCEQVKKAFSLESVKVFGALDQEIQKIAVCPGSGKSVISAAIAKKADVLVTGDIGHHEGIDAVAQGMAIIDAGHYGVEHIFIEDIKEYLERRLKDVEIIGAPIVHPFIVL